MVGAGASAAALVAGHLVLTACGEPSSTRYGNPNTLDRKSIPGEGGVESVICSGDAAPPGFEAGACPSFATDIFPYVKADGGWHCADKGCHGGTSAPPIENASAAACFASLQKITVGGKGYIVQAPDAGLESTFLCNLQGTCGSKMPKVPPGTEPTPADLCKVQAWLACGAPP